MSTLGTAATKIVEFLGAFGSFKYVFKNGKDAVFVNKKFRTDVESEIEELQEEVRLRHPHILSYKVLTEGDLDPMIGLRQRFFNEFAAEQEKLAADRVAAVDGSKNLDLNPVFVAKGALNTKGTPEGSLSAAEAKEARIQRTVDGTDRIPGQIVDAKEPATVGILSSNDLPLPIVTQPAKGK